MPPQIFICYAHGDNDHADPGQRWLDRLRELLRPLEFQGYASVWVDLDIKLGEEWHQKIEQTLEQIKVAILLVSPKFLASKYIRNSELPVLQKRANEGELVIIPILIRQCPWKTTIFKYPDPQNGPYEFSLSTIQMPSGEPLNAKSEHEQDETLNKVYESIYNIFKSPPKKSPPKKLLPAPQQKKGQSLEEEAQRNMREVERIRAKELKLDDKKFVEYLKKKLPEDGAIYDLLDSERLREYIYGQRSIVLETSEEILEAARQLSDERQIE